MPLEVRRGYWVDWTRFYQEGEQVDRSSVKERLAKIPRSADAASTAASLETAMRVTGVAGILLLGWGISQKIGLSEVSDETRTKLLIGSGVSLGASLGFGFGAEGLYIKAVNQYNEPLQLGSEDDE